MKGYDPKSTDFFNIEDSIEIKCWVTLLSGNSDVVLCYYKRYVGIEVLSYELKNIPENFRKNRSDCAKLLVLHLADGKTICKRHNNSQHLNIKE